MCTPSNDVPGTASIYVANHNKQSQNFVSRVQVIVNASIYVRKSQRTITKPIRHRGKPRNRKNVIAVARDPENLLGPQFFLVVVCTVPRDMA